MTARMVFWPLLGASLILVLMAGFSIHFAWVRSGPVGLSDRSRARQRRLKVTLYSLLAVFGLWTSFELGKEDRADVEEAARTREFLGTPAGAVWQEHPVWSWDVCRLVAARKVDIGMTGAQVSASIGSPGETRHKRFVGAVLTEWIYANGPHVCLERGIVTAVVPDARVASQIALGRDALDRDGVAQ